MDKARIAELRKMFLEIRTGDALEESARKLTDAKNECLDAIEALQRERDAYKKAKEENDDRFIAERDALRALNEKAKEAMHKMSRKHAAENNALRAQLEAVQPKDCCRKTMEEWSIITYDEEMNRLRTERDSLRAQLGRANALLCRVKALGNDMGLMIEIDEHLKQSGAGGV